MSHALSQDERAAAERIIALLREHSPEAQRSIIWQSLVLMGESRLASDVLNDKAPSAKGTP